MPNDDELQEIMKLILQGNELMKRQAEERQVILKKIIAETKHPKAADERHADLVKDLEEHIEDKESSEFLKMTKLSYLNSLISEIDQKQESLHELVLEAMQLEANINSRNELISILEEYCSMEKASIHKLVANYSEAQDILQDQREQFAIYEAMSKNDPRYKALEVLKQHEEGISIVQLSYSLNTTAFQANKIIRELIDVGLVEERGILLKISEQVDVGGIGFQEQVIHI